LVITCPHCSAKYKVRPESIGDRGKNIRCKKCQQAMRINPDGSISKLKLKSPPNLNQPTESEHEGHAAQTVQISADQLQKALGKRMDPDEFSLDIPRPQAPSKSPSIPQRPTEPQHPQLTDFNPFEGSADSDEFPVFTPDQKKSLNQDPSATQQMTLPNPTSLAPPEDAEIDLPLSAKQQPEDLDASFSNSGEFGFQFLDEPSLPSPPPHKESSPAPQPSQGKDLPFSLDFQGSDEPLDVRTQAMPTLQSAEEFPGLDRTVEVPETDQDEAPRFFDAFIEGQNYPGVPLETIHRWIIEGRLLEKDQVSLAGKEAFQDAVLIPQLREQFESAFPERHIKKKEKPAKTGFFSRWFRRKS
jgi:predicted Zn finger-like uncharacterized protein